jgi:hypothetical protein
LEEAGIGRLAVVVIVDLVAMEDETGCRKERVDGS